MKAKSAQVVVKKTKEQKAKEKMDAMIADLEARLSIIIIQTLEKRTTLLEIIKESGVKNLVVYYNIIELTKKATAKTGNKVRTAIKVFDYGIEFNNGFKIRHVSKPNFDRLKKYIPDLELIKIRERVPDYNPLASEQSKLDI